MKRDGCGRQFDAREAEFASRNEPISPGGRRPYTKLVWLYLCPSCGGSRRNTLWFIVLSMLFVFLGGAIVGLLTR
jgi:hypothetical protein